MTYDEILARLLLPEPVPPTHLRMRDRARACEGRALGESSSFVEIDITCRVCLAAMLIRALKSHLRGT